MGGGAGALGGAATVAFGAGGALGRMGVTVTRGVGRAAIGFPLPAPEPAPVDGDGRSEGGSLRSMVMRGGVFGAAGDAPAAGAGDGVDAGCDANG
jgi:hypothetical protein